MAITCIARDVLNVATLTTGNRFHLKIFAYFTGLSSFSQQHNHGSGKAGWTGYYRVTLGVRVGLCYEI